MSFDWEGIDVTDEKSMNRLTPEREDQLRRLHASDPTGKLCATQRELLAEIDALAARVRELEAVRTDAEIIVDFIIGWWPGLEDGIAWGTPEVTSGDHPVYRAAKRLRAALAPTQRDTP